MKLFASRDKKQKEMLVEQNARFGANLDRVVGVMQEQNAVTQRIIQELVHGLQNR